MVGTVDGVGCGGCLGADVMFFFFLDSFHAVWFAFWDLSSRRHGVRKVLEFLPLKADYLGR